MVVIVVVSALYAGQERSKTPPPRDATLTGTIVDLQNFMTGKYNSSDRKRCTQESLRAGVPAALETDDGLVIIGEGTKGPQRTIMPLALQYVELKGKLYEHNGLRYIDITSAKPTKPRPKPYELEPQTPDKDELDQEEQPFDGACCFSDSDCYVTDQNDFLE